MNKCNSECKKLETAVILARMYGVRETMEPLPVMSNERVVDLITTWTEEYFNIGMGDIVQFFESRFG